MPPSPDAGETLEIKGFLAFRVRLNPRKSGSAVVGLSAANRIEMLVFETINGASPLVDTTVAKAFAPSQSAAVASAESDTLAKSSSALEIEHRLPEGTMPSLEYPYATSRERTLAGLCVTHAIW